MCKYSSLWAQGGLDKLILSGEEKENVCVHLENSRLGDILEFLQWWAESIESYATGLYINV